MLLLLPLRGVDNLLDSLVPSPEDNPLSTQVHQAFFNLYYKKWRSLALVHIASVSIDLLLDLQQVHQLIKIRRDHHHQPYPRSHLTTPHPEQCLQPRLLQALFGQVLQQACRRAYNQYFLPLNIPPNGLFLPNLILLK